MSFLTFPPNFLVSLIVASKMTQIRKSLMKELLSIEQQILSSMVVFRLAKLIASKHYLVLGKCLKTGVLELNWISIPA